MDDKSHTWLLNYLDRFKIDDKDVAQAKQDEQRNDPQPLLDRLGRPTQFHTPYQNHTPEPIPIGGKMTAAVRETYPARRRLDTDQQ